MPYIKNLNKSINILYIHIPKTGGTTIEKYLSYQFNYGKPLSLQNLYSSNINKFKFVFYGSLQHQSYRTLMKYKNKFGIVTTNLKVFASVRNPYTKIVSDLFYFKLINKNSSQLHVYNNLIKFIFAKNKFDNHNLPQYTFVINNRGVIPSHINIINNESLTKDMINLGYINFDKINIQNKGRVNKNNYYKYLDNNSIKLINHIYDKDFKLFNYTKIESELKSTITTPTITTPTITTPTDTTTSI